MIARSRLSITPVRSRKRPIVSSTSAATRASPAGSASVRIRYSCPRIRTETNRFAVHRATRRSPRAGPRVRRSARRGRRCAARRRAASDSAAATRLPVRRCVGPARRRHVRAWCSRRERGMSFGQSLHRSLEAIDVEHFPGVPRRGELGRAVIGGNRNSPRSGRVSAILQTRRETRQVEFPGFRRRRRVIGAVSAR